MRVGMGVRFVIGRAGAGKTRHCFDRIVKMVRAEPWGKPILWIVPKQATFETERALTAALGAFARVRIFSFENFGDAVLAECGGAARSEVTPRGRQMILGWILRSMKDQLQYFGGVAGHAGLIAKLDATFVELERFGKTPGDLEAAGDEAADTFGKKIADLKKIYQSYLEFLGQDRVDPHRRLQEVLFRMEGCKLLKDASIFIDGFLDYRETERLMIAGMAKACGELAITVLADLKAQVFSNPDLIPDETGLFYRTEMAYRELFITLRKEHVAVDSPVMLREPARFKSKSLARIEREFLQHVIDPGAAAEFFRCEDRRGEAMCAAAQAALLAMKGMRYRDILVLCRDIDDYADYLAAAFAEHGVACFIDRRRTVAHHPLLQLLRGIFIMVRQNWPHDAVMSVLKTGLAGLELDEADELENYVLAHRIRGEKIWIADEPWTFHHRRMVGYEEEELVDEKLASREADRLRKKASAPIARFTQQINESALTVKQRAVAVFTLLEDLKVRQKLGEWMRLAENENDLEQQAEHEQMWNRLVDLFDEMVQLLGEQPVSFEDFADIVDAGAESFDLALTPPTVDQVLIGQIDRTRSGQHRATILLGMNEGQFPLVATEDSILNDAERAELKNRKLDLEGDTQQKRRGENLLAYLAMTRSSDRMILTRSIADSGGRQTMASMYWRMLGNPEGTKFGPRLEDISTCTQAVSRLIKWVRLGAKSSPVPEGVYQWLHAAGGDDAIAKLRDQAWPALQYDNAAKLQSDTAAALFHRPLLASVSQLETFAACPFKHFLRYGLRLEMREEEEPSVLDFGNLYHEALRKMVVATLRDKLDWANLPEKLARDLVWNSTEEVGKELRQELMISSARNRHLLGWIGRTLEKVTASQRAIFKRGQFRPVLAEMVFGKGGETPALTLITPKGNRLDLRGKIDRVDLHQNGRAFSVIDYKTSSKRLELDRVWHGVSLQLLIYLLVIQEYGQKLWGNQCEAAAGFYVELLRRLQSVSDPREAPGPGDAKFDLRHKPRGLVRVDYLAAFDDQLAPGTISDVLHVQLKKDGGLGEKINEAISGEDLKLLLDHVRQKVAELADRILDGNVEAHPYRLGTETPCPHCDYRSICRFQTGVNRYLHIQPLGRKVVLEQLKGTGAS